MALLTWLLVMGHAANDEDEPRLTRWSFEDFEHFYDVKFGTASEQQLRKRRGGGGATSERRGGGGATSDGGGEDDGNDDDEDAADSRDGSANDGWERQERRATAHDTSAASTSSSLADVHTAAAAGSGVKRRKPLPRFPTAEQRDLAEAMSRDIFRGNSGVTWDSIKGLETAKKLLKEAVVMPIKYPRYFTGLLSPWKGILLFGPPGTGKTMLAKAVASECDTTFFNISASSLISKWRGESEKSVRTLFELARHYAPSTIFLDEVDALMGQRGEGTGEHEASRRVKTELLVQMDGLAQSQDMVFVLAATNLPWELDKAMLRRLEKRIMVPLPEPEAREAMFAALLPTLHAEGREKADVLIELADGTEGYSGSDIRLVCKEANMRPVRRILVHLEATEKDQKCQDDEVEVEETACIERQEVHLEPGPVSYDDVMMALRATKSSGHVDYKRYTQFFEEFGSHAY